MCIKKMENIKRASIELETRVEVWENEEWCGEHESHPQLFRVLPNFHKCFYNSIEILREHVFYFF